MGAVGQIHKAWSRGPGAAKGHDRTVPVNVSRESKAGRVGRPLDCIANVLACQAEQRRASHMRSGCVSGAERRALYAL